MRLRVAGNTGVCFRRAKNSGHTSPAGCVAGEGGYFLMMLSLLVSTLPSE